MGREGRRWWEGRGKEERKEGDGMGRAHRRREGECGELRALGLKDRKSGRSGDGGIVATLTVVGDGKWLRRLGLFMQLSRRLTRSLVTDDFRLASCESGCSLALPRDKRAM